MFTRPLPPPMLRNQKCPMCRRSTQYHSWPISAFTCKNCNAFWRQQDALDKKQGNWEDSDTPPCGESYHIDGGEYWVCILNKGHRLGDHVSMYGNKW